MEQRASIFAIPSRHATRLAAWRLQSVLLSAFVVLPVLLGTRGAQAEPQLNPVLRVESNAAGEIGLEAHGARLEDVLSAIGAKTGFEVLIEPGLTRPPVSITLAMAPVEDVLREILRGRNYALVYDGDDALLSQVIVLRPSVPGPRTATYRRPYRR
jgi:hypothetical protein